MRTVFILGFLLLAGVAGFFVKVPRVHDYMLGLFSQAEQIAYTKTLRIDGLEHLNQSQISLGDLEDRSVMWWYLNSAEIESRIKENPLVADAMVTRCSGWTWGCFQISLMEREPVLLARMGEEIWVVGNDGGFITPLSSANFDLVAAQFGKKQLQHLPVIDGLLPDQAAFDQFRPRFNYIKQAMQTVQEASGLKIALLNLTGEGEMQVRFHTLPMQVTFGLAEEDSAVLQRETARLKELLRSFRQNPTQIKSIDLAYDNQAVVKLF